MCRMDYEYRLLVEDVLLNGGFSSRSGVADLSALSRQYTVDLSSGFPLLTTRKLDGFRWKSLLYELGWYLQRRSECVGSSSGGSYDDCWVDDGYGPLGTSVGRFWRRFPGVSPSAQLAGESWGDVERSWMYTDTDGSVVSDQLRYVVDVLANRVPDTSPYSRDLLVSTWHPGTDTVSKSSAQDWSFVVSLHDDKIHMHVNQRSGSVAVDVPFTIALYGVLLHVIANETPFDVGTITHTIVHPYISIGESRYKWYAKNVGTIRDKIRSVEYESYESIAEWIRTEAPLDPNETDHVPLLLRQISREPYSKPHINTDSVTIDTYTPTKVTVENYECHDELVFNTTV